VTAEAVVGADGTQPAADGTQPSASVIRAEHVMLTFDGNAGLHDLGLSVPPGTIFGVVGPSGSGKTTAVRLILGTQVPESGSLSVFGRSPDRFSPADRRRIGYLPQAPALYPELSLRHNLNLAASLYGLPWRSRFWPTKAGKAARKRLADTLEFVGLTEQQGTRLRDASGGEQRRIGLAAALIHEPDLLVLDEPTAGIDPMLRHRIWGRLAELRDDGVTLLITTQYVEEAADCDLVAVLVDGRTLVVDTPAGLRKRAYRDAPAPEGSTFNDVFVRLITQYQAQDNAQDQSQSSGAWSAMPPGPVEGEGRDDG
jgi:ABC-2 type transport system ATP-binding protein